MEKFANDNLILLEFLVDNICFEYSVQKSLKCMDGETCVAFQFLDNAPLYVCEEDFSPKNQNYADGCKGCNKMKNGKSCLFALNPKQAQQCMKQFDIYVEVFIKMKPGLLPEKMILGESLISILNLFKEMVDAFNASADDEPVAKTMKDCFKIQNISGELVGRIGVYIRMSTFGRLIVTQFQMNVKDKSVEFKAKEGHYLFTTKTKEAKQGNKKILDGSLSDKNVLDLPCGLPKESEKKPCINEEVKCPRPPPCPQPQLGLDANAGMQRPISGMQIGTLTQPPSSCPPQCPIQQPEAPRIPQVQFAPCDPCLNQNQAIYPQQSAATSSVQSPLPSQFLSQCPLCGSCPPSTCPVCGSSGIPPSTQMYQNPAMAHNPLNQMSMQMPMQNPAILNPCETYKSQMNVSNPTRLATPCNECDNSNEQPEVPPPPNCAYQEFGAEMGGNSLIIRVHKDQAQVDEVRDDQCCCEPGGKPKDAVYPVTQSSPCNCSNQTGSGGKAGQKDKCPDCCPDNTTPFTFKMGGTTQADNRISVLSPTTNGNDNGGKLGNLADPTKEVFILRIGKKNESASKKNHMEIEVCTPKGKGYKPPEPKVDTEQQCEPQNEKETKSGGKKGKGKKDKKGKKGKKGKK